MSPATAYASRPEGISNLIQSGYSCIFGLGSLLVQEKKYKLIRTERTDVFINELKEAWKQNNLHNNLNIRLKQIVKYLKGSGLLVIKMYQCCLQSSYTFSKKHNKESPAVRLGILCYKAENKVSTSFARQLLYINPLPAGIGLPGSGALQRLSF